MDKNRLEAFSDGVLAIIITIMVIEMEVPAGDSIHDLIPLLPTLLSYLLSFFYLGIYWSNHHHMLHTLRTVTGGILWANLHLLFWLSLIPFATAWIGETRFGETPAAIYGGILLMAALAYFLLQHLIIRSQGENSLLKKAVGKDIKGKFSAVLYAIAIISAFWFKWFTFGIYLFVALMWLIPDQRIEQILSKEDAK